MGYTQMGLLPVLGPDCSPPFDQIYNGNRQGEWWTGFRPRTAVPSAFASVPTAESWIANNCSAGLVAPSRLSASDIAASYSSVPYVTALADRGTFRQMRARELLNTLSPGISQVGSESLVASDKQDYWSALMWPFFSEIGSAAGNSYTQFISWIDAKKLLKDDDTDNPPNPIVFENHVLSEVAFFMSLLHSIYLKRLGEIAGGDKSFGVDPLHSLYVDPGPFIGDPAYAGNRAAMLFALESVEWMWDELRAGRGPVNASTLNSISAGVSGGPNVSPWGRPEFSTKYSFSERLRWGFKTSATKLRWGHVPVHGSV
jgi:hypothetical protein